MGRDLHYCTDLLLHLAGCVLAAILGEEQHEAQPALLELAENNRYNAMDFGTSKHHP